MAVVEFKQDVEELIQLAANAATEGKYVICVHNLNDALKQARGNDERSAVYKCFSDMFSGMNNAKLGRNALFRSCMPHDVGGYYSLAYDKFFPVEGEEFSDEFPVPDAETILGYNDVYNYFLMGQYDQGFDILCNLMPDVRCLDEVIGVLYEAIEQGKRIDLSKHAHKLLILAGLFSTKSGDFVRLMLQGGHLTSAIMIDSVQVFCEEVEDRRVLCNIGEAFVDEGEYDCARMCFERVLEECEIDEKALFYLAAMAAFLNEEEDYEKYWSRYKLVYQPFGAPVELYERMFEDDVPVYGVIHSSVVKQDVDLLKINFSDDKVKSEALCDVLSFGTDEMLRGGGIYKSISDEVYFNTVKQIMLSAYVSESRKVKLLGRVFEKNYEGRMAIAFYDKGVSFDCVPLQGKTTSSFWHKIFVQLSVKIVSAKEFLPYKPSFLSHTITQMRKKCKAFKIKPDENDEHFISVMIATFYSANASAKTNIPISDELVSALTAKEIRAGLDKFPPEVITS